MENIEIVLQLFRDCAEFDDCYDFVSPAIYKLRNEGWHCASGVTRVAVWHDTWDYVLKIDRNYDEQFYCSLEAYNYSLAKEHGVERVLLPIERVAIVNGWKIYRQVKYDCGWDDRKSRQSQKLRRECQKVKVGKAFDKISRNLDRRLANAWIARATQLYGKHFMRSLENWVAQAKVCDLHSNNIGFYKKKPVLIDYAGYFGSNGSLPVDKKFLEKF